MDYLNRLAIPITGDSNTEFRTESGTLIAIGYERIVIGGRGPYIEFSDVHIQTSNMNLPIEQEWRLSSSSAYYVEFRTSDAANVKIYFQLKTVDYADYKINYFYISPFDLYVNNNKIITKI